ncbi:beta-eliminating lyase-related protein [Tistrella mobilis]
MPRMETRWWDSHPVPRTQTMIDLRSDLMGSRPAAVAAAMTLAALQPPAMTRMEDPYERRLSEGLADELGVEAVLLVPSCTMANQIAIRLHLPGGGLLASAPLAHVVTVEAGATALTGITARALSTENGHPTPDAVGCFLRDHPAVPALVWLENTQMLAAGSVMPAGWQADIATLCREAGRALHLDGSRLWNAAVAMKLPMSAMTAGCDTAAVSLNKAIGAPLGAVLAGTGAMIDEAARWRSALGGDWRPIGAVAAAALAALDGWRDRLEADAHRTRMLAEGIVERFGEQAIHPVASNLIFLNRPAGDADAFVEALAGQGVGAITITPEIVRLAVHSGVRDRDIAPILEALSAADARPAVAS